MKPTITEIKNITADAVAKKQDAAKINFPIILDKIKAAANKGESSCLIPISQMTHWDKELLVSEEFTVRLIDKVYDRYLRGQLGQYVVEDTKIWEIKW